MSDFFEIFHSKDFFTSLSFTLLNLRSANSDQTLSNLKKMGFMKKKRAIVRQILVLLRNLNSEEAKLGEVETVYRDGSVVGYRIEIKAKARPCLKLVKNEKT